MAEHPSITLEPVVSYPRVARPGGRYLLSVDLRHDVPSDRWPYAEEEYPLTCLLDTLPLFSHRAMGDATVVVHRHGGSYGPAVFLLTAAAGGEMTGTIRITLVTQGGLPAEVLELGDIRIAAGPAPEARPQKAVPLPPTVTSFPVPEVATDAEAGSEEAPSDPEVVVGLAGLPVDGPDLFGREAELKWLYRCWSEGAHVASIVAGAGVGKSALVKGWLRDVSDQGWLGAERVYGWSFPHGGGGPSSSDEFVDAALSFFGDPLPSQGSPWDKGERLAALVRQHRTLLVLDDLEPLQGRAGPDEGRIKDPVLATLVKELGARNAGLCVLTSRRRIEELEDLAGDKCRKLLLEERPTEPGLLFPDGPENAILRLLSLFDGPASKGEIAALREPPLIPGLTDALPGLDSPKWRAALARLRAAELVAEGSEGGLDLSPRAREQLGQQLRESSMEAWREGHQRLFEHLQRTTKELPETVEEMAPLYSAVVHGCRAGRYQEAFEEVYLRRIQRNNEAFHSTWLGAPGVLVAVLSAFFDPPWERLAPGLTELCQDYVLNDAAFALRAQGRMSEAAGLMRTALDHALALGDWRNAARYAGGLGELAVGRGELEEALGHAWQSIELADRSGVGAVRVARIATLARVLHQQGRVAEAADHFDNAARAQMEMDPAQPWIRGVPGYYHVDLLIEQEREDEALERAWRTLEWARSEGPFAVALAHLSLGRAHLRAAQRGGGGKLDEAALQLHQAVDALLRAGQQEHVPLGLLARAELHRVTGDLPRARADLDAASSIAVPGGMRLHEADARLGYARLHLAANGLDDARLHLAKARELVMATGYHRRDQDLSALEADVAKAAEARRTVTVFGGSERAPEAPAPRSGGTLAGAQIKLLSEALLSAFPTRSELAQMLRFELDTDLEHITLGKSLSATVFEVLMAAEREGWVLRLADAALRRVPGNVTLSRALDALAGVARAPAGDPSPAAPSGLRRPGKLAGALLSELSEALLEAFPTRSALAEMLLVELEKRLEEIATPGALSSTVFEVLTAAEHEGWLLELAEGALRSVSGNPALRRAVEHVAEAARAVDLGSEPPLVLRADEPLTAAQMRVLTEALLGAFPTRSALDHMLRIELEKHLDDHVAQVGLRETVFELLTLAAQEGWVPELIEAAQRYVPGNAMLRAIVGP